MTDKQLNLDRLIDRITDGTMDREGFSQLEARLLADPALRRRFRSRMRLEANLHSECQASPVEILSPAMFDAPRPRLVTWPMAAVAGIAAMLVVTLFFFFPRDGAKNLEPVATLVSEDGAAWSAGHRLADGAELAPGIISLEQGLFSLRFASGVIASLEAPVTIELLNPMRCRLSRGKAVFEVPDSAIGFVVETPNGYAVDHGTRFAVALEEGSDQVEFGVLSGLISVYHEKTKASTKVRTGDRVLLTRSGIDEAKRETAMPSTRVVDHEVIRFRTNGRETSIVRGDMREDFLDPDLLMVKKDVPVSNEGQMDRLLRPKDRRALIAFDLDRLQGRQVELARLRLNLVPSDRGFAMLLPELTTIEVYGVRDRPELESWDSASLQWAHAPGSTGEGTDIDESEVILLGSFQIERSRMDGPVIFESPELTRWVNQDRTGVLGILLVSASMPQDHWSRVHAFASSHHVEAAGPSLEVHAQPLQQ